VADYSDVDKETVYKRLSAASDRPRRGRQPVPGIGLNKSQSLPTQLRQQIHNRNYANTRAFSASHM